MSPPALCCVQCAVSRRPLVALCLAFCCLAGLARLASASSPTDTSVPPTHEFQIARLIYTSYYSGDWGPGRPWWAIDWPEAEQHFTAGVSRYTRIDIAPDSKHISLDDDAIFDYPWLFAQQVGHWTLTERQIERLREYLDRGGFLVVDDFHGPQQWAVFQRVIDSALPSRPIVDIPEDDQLMNVLYELDKSTQIPGRRHLRQSGQGVVVRMPHSPPQWKGVYDEQGRLVVAINYNMDMGDAWEHADDPVYPVEMTALAYRFGINYIVYAMTH